MRALMPESIPWLQTFSDALDGEYPARPRVFSLATVTPAGLPAVRTVILRHLDDHGRLSFTTDARSAKLAHLARTPAAEACFWLPGWREQYRLTGPIQPLGPDAAGPLRGRLWREHSDANRAMYFWPDPLAAASTDPVTPAVVADTPIPPNFLVLTLVPDTVEQLELNFMPHRRRVWRRTTGWREERVNP